MSRWLDMAAQLQAGQLAAQAPEKPPIGTIGPIGTGSLPPSVADGLAQLRAMAAPRITRPEVWPGIVADAVRLAEEGWAAKALALGWEPVHLWGCSPDKGGNPDHDGLAVMLCGSPVTMLDAGSAMVKDSARSFRIFTRRPMPGAILLWEIGSVRQ